MISRIAVMRPGELEFPLSIKININFAQLIVSVHKMVEAIPVYFLKEELF